MYVRINLLLLLLLLIKLTNNHRNDNCIVNRILYTVHNSESRSNFSLRLRILINKFKLPQVSNFILISHQGIHQCYLLNNTQYIFFDNTVQC